METFTTTGLPSIGRTDAWNALWEKRMSRVGFAPVDQQSRFDAELRIGRLGPVKLAKLWVDRCSIERTQADIGHSPRIYSFLLQAEGSSTFFHCGQEAHLSEGDFVLCDTGLPHYWVTRDPSVTIMVRVEPRVLREHLPTPEQFRGLRLGRAVGLTDTVSAMVQSLANRVEYGIDPAYEDQVARHLLEMMSMSYTMGFKDTAGGSATLWQRRNDVVRYIEENLRDPSLTPASIAEGLRLSPRYLRTIFSVSGERVSAYILRRRLEECARKMRNAAWRGHSLTEIAFSWGFNSSAHFTRSFHEQFGMAPRDYRRHILERETAA